MCNSSLQIDNSTLDIDETLKWYMYCVCRGHFGTLIITIISSLFFLMGTPILSYSLWFYLHRNIKSKIVFPLNITIVELFFCFQNCMDLTVTSYLSIATYKLAVFLNGLCWTVRPLLQICMCVEHYLAVIQPVTFLKCKDIRYRIVLVTVSWLIGLANGLRLIFNGLDIFPDHTFFMLFCLALIITSFCCASVLHALKRPGPGDRNNVEMTEKDRHNKTDRGRAVENRKKSKAFKIISNILVSILICYVPQVVAYFTLISDISKETYMCNFFPLSLSIAVVTVTVSPLLRMYNEGHLKCICDKWKTSRAN